MNVTKTHQDDELIALLKQKNLHAFSCLYDKYAAALYTVILQIVKNKEIAKDIIEKVFHVIAREIYNYDPAKERLLIWMFKIARNAAIDVMRSESNQQASEQSMQIEKVSDAVSNFNIDDYGLRRVIMKLKEEQIILIDLSYYKGFTIDEIAKRLDISLPAANSGLTNALSALRTLL